MQYTTFKQTNHLMGAGGNPNTGDLPVCFALAPHYSEGKAIPFTISRWKLTPEELKTVQETGEIWISIMGGGMPPIMPLAEDPFGPPHNFKPIPHDVLKRFLIDNKS